MKPTACPRCDRYFNPKFGALSRVDNETKICADCGSSEALYQMNFRDADLPPLNQGVPWFTV